MGVSAEHVGEMGLATATDELILDLGRQRQAVVVTLDTDFHRLLAGSHETSPSVVPIRIEGLSSDQLAAIVVQVLAVATAELDARAVVSVTKNRIRVLSLPIVR